jgi:hypothetical protein
MPAGPNGYKYGQQQWNNDWQEKTEVLDIKSFLMLVQMF